MQPINKCFADGDPWIQTADGWVSGKYLTGWVCQDGRWWYLLSGTLTGTMQSARLTGRRMRLIRMAG